MSTHSKRCRLRNKEECFSSYKFSVQLVPFNQISISNCKGTCVYCFSNFGRLLERRARLTWRRQPATRRHWTQLGPRSGALTRASSCVCSAPSRPRTLLLCSTSTRSATARRWTKWSRASSPATSRTAFLRSVRICSPCTVRVPYSCTVLSGLWVEKLCYLPLWSNGKLKIWKKMKLAYEYNTSECFLWRMIRDFTFAYFECLVATVRDRSAYFALRAHAAMTVCIRILPLIAESSSTVIVHYCIAEILGYDTIPRNRLLFQGILF